MKHVVLIAFFWLLAAPAGWGQATEIPLVADPPASYFRLTEDAFTATYGFNDTARAIIRLYYAKWETGKRIMYIAGAPASLVTALGRHYEAGPYGAGVNYASYYYDPWVAPVVSTLLAGTIFGFIKATKWNRRQLYEAIRRYHDTRRLPDSVPPALLAALLPTRPD